MTDYWVSKLFFDLHHDAKLAAEYRADMRTTSRLPSRMKSPRRNDTFRR